MFDFRNGMLGVVVVAVAIGAALFASYFAGIESVEHDVVKYNELADVTGLFDTETSPQYVDYDPSSNYTGYYSEDSYSAEMGEYYFAEERVNYKPNVDQYGNLRVNNYKVNLIPMSHGSVRINISDVTGLEQTDKRYMVLYHPQSNDSMWSWGLDKAYKLSSLIENLTFAEGTNTLYITTNNTDWSQTNLDVPLLLPDSWFDEGWTTIYNPSADPSTIDTVYQKHPPYQSFIIDLLTKSITAYTDTDYSQGAISYRLDSMILFYGDDPESLGNNHLNLSYYIAYTEYNIRTSYLDPNYGVNLKDYVEPETVSAYTLHSYADSTYQITSSTLYIESERNGDYWYTAFPSVVKIVPGESKVISINKRGVDDWFHTSVRVTIERVDP